jgi:predicted transcriptional regulator
MKVLLSIKPQFAELIFDGSKKFEFRKAIFKNENITTVVVYASSPMQKVIGEFKIDSILSDEPTKLWKRTKDHAGINKEYFDEYFADRAKGFAIKVKSVKKYAKPLCLRDDFKLTPPQSFMYLD